MTDKDFYAKRNPVTGEFYDPRMQPRFTELATFMRAPVADDLSAIDIGLIEVLVEGNRKFLNGDLIVAIR